MLKSLKEIFLDLWSRGYIKILLLVVLIIIAISVWSSIPKGNKDLKKVQYSQELLGTNFLPEKIQVVFDLKDQIKIPSKLAVYQLNKLSEDQILKSFNNVISGLEIKGTPKTLKGENYKVLLISGKDEIFQGNVLFGNFSYQGNYKSKLSFQTNDEAVTSSRKLLEQLGIQTVDFTSKESVSFLKKSGMEYLHSPTKEGADFVSIQSWQKIDNYRVLPVGVYQGVNVIANIKSGEVVTIKYSFAPISKDSKQEFKTIALNNLDFKKTNQIYTLNLTNSGYQAMLTSVQNAQKLTIKSTEIVYLSSKNEENYLLPAYLFKGTLELEDGTKNDFEGYTPAIQTN